MSLPLERRDDQHLTDPWSDLVGVGVVVIHGHVTSKGIHSAITGLVLLKTTTDDDG